MLQKVPKNVVEDPFSRENISFYGTNIYRKHCLYSDSGYTEFQRGTHKNLGWTNPLKEYRHGHENLESI